MRLLVAAAGMIVLGTFLVATAPTATATGYCVQNVKEYPYDDCDGLVCVGYNQSGWQTCVPPEVHCLHGMPCECYYDVENGGYYCP